MTTERDFIDEPHAQADADRDPETTPDVDIIMGSNSDLDMMSGAHEALDTFGFGKRAGFDASPEEHFSYKMYVVSAHRTPDLMYVYGDTARDRGVEVVIVGVGGESADLPNMTTPIAYPIPIVGVPVQEKSVDSAIGMPTGTSIIAVDAGKSLNTAPSAIQVLSHDTPELEGRFVDYHEDLVFDMAETSAALHDLGAAGFRELW